ncbi:DUF4112 domain-containing protein [Tautonia plasticadhaerens]|uniref:DUF4112 domain-containing protein n=1 Tax=Tautonia plasticadhaerens TaxID=2527974 RepID=A0A518H858_9BACT|nr:DUF4112 domain-containing protein [Tautonia plasticadhaerens]QDV37024.1 hypothetical protein ElP_49570 [Tautonia plasticadhaerens]
MATVKPTRVQPERLAPEQDRVDAVLEQLAWLLDAKFRLPGTSIRFGVDAIAGILPVIGDVPLGLVQAGLIGLAMHHYKLPKGVIGRMVFNVLLDTTVGSIPVLGTIFDVGYKANLKNVNLVREAIKAKRAR